MCGGTRRWRDESRGLVIVVFELMAHCRDDHVGAAADLEERHIARVAERNDQENSRTRRRLAFARSAPLALKLSDDRIGLVNSFSLSRVIPKYF